MLPLVSTFRELRDFLAAKRLKREPLRWLAKGAGAAKYIPRHAEGFENFRIALRGVGDFGKASERLDALEHALRRRHGVGLPLPRKILQNEDRSITLFWDGCMVRCFVDGFVSTIGGVAGAPARNVTTELLDALALQSRIQRTS